MITKWVQLYSSARTGRIVAGESLYDSEKDARRYFQDPVATPVAIVKIEFEAREEYLAWAKEKGIVP